MQQMKFHIVLATYFHSKPLYLDGENYTKPTVRKLVEQLGQIHDAARKGKSFSQLEIESDILEKRKLRNYYQSTKL